MAITSNSLDIRGQVVEPIIEEILFQNNTLSKGLVTFEDDVKANTIFTEGNAEAVMQEWISGDPETQGSLNTWDYLVTPKKVMFYQTFDPDALRFTRFKRSMKPGAWENFSTEFERVIIGGIYAKQISLSAERAFWLGATDATKDTIAVLSTSDTDNTLVSLAERTMVGTSLGRLTIEGTSNYVQATEGRELFDGLLTKIIFNDIKDEANRTYSVGGRIKVVGTTITSENIKGEYDKLYQAIPAEVLQNGEKPTIYAPYSHAQFITIYNNNADFYRDSFAVSGESYGFNGLNIEFVPIPENVILCAKKSHLFWVTDLLSDVNTMKIDRIAANREDYFIKSCMSEGAHVSNQKFNVLYVG